MSEWLQVNDDDRQLMRLVEKHAEMVMDHAEALNRVREGLAVSVEMISNVLIKVGAGEMSQAEMERQLENLAGALNDHYLGPLDG